MKANDTRIPARTIDRERLNRLMDAIALIVARRQMKQYWSTNHHRAVLSSIV